MKKATRGKQKKKKIKSHRVKIEGGEEDGGLKKRTHSHPPPIHPSQLVEIRASLLSACYFSLLLPHLLSLSVHPCLARPASCRPPAFCHVWRYRFASVLTIKLRLRFLNNIWRTEGGRREEGDERAAKEGGNYERKRGGKWEETKEINRRVEGVRRRIKWRKG